MLRSYSRDQEKPAEAAPAPEPEAEPSLQEKSMAMAKDMGAKVQESSAIVVDKTKEYYATFTTWMTVQVKKTPCATPRAAAPAEA